MSMSEKEQRRHAVLLPTLAWRAGLMLVDGLHTAAMAWHRSATMRARGTGSNTTEPDWRSKFKQSVLLIRGDLAKTSLIAILELC